MKDLLGFQLAIGDMVLLSGKKGHFYIGVLTNDQDPLKIKTLGNTWLRRQDRELIRVGAGMLRNFCDRANLTEWFKSKYVDALKRDYEKFSGHPFPEQED